MPLLRRTAAEALGTAFLLAAVVGSGIMAERLAGGNVALALLANAIATGAVLFALIVVFANVSGAHFNPAVTIAMMLRRTLGMGEAAGYVGAQVVGAMAGVAAAHAMFDLPLFSMSEQAREGSALVWSEFVATFGLVLVVFGASRHGVPATALAVGAYIAAAYWFTASTSFANPAVSIARALTDSFSGIRITDVPWFIAAQLVAATAACVAGRLIFTMAPTEAPDPSPP
ncbi:aquaporin family protein [Luteimonas marina]|uniref:Aquaporin family protein n=1 Tax=Luteimonas marina TaxID=488485 RepID=A0A5C5U9V7_9GAMM|nr:aquaporin [Luteimonas marina]TWT22657.1 aquaporin family protein [Luteimonas marina]